MALSADNADLLICARRCHSFAPQTAGADAVLIRAGRIEAIGQARRLRRQAGRSVRRLELPWATLTPGLVDCHTHFFWWALQQALIIDVTGLPTLEQTLERIRREANRKTVGQWVVASGFDPNLWGGGFPTADDLDRAVADRPVMVRSRDGHSVWLNRRGLQAAGIRDDQPDPPGGRYLRDRHGRPTGIVQEAAIDLLPNPLAEFASRRDPQACRIIDRAVRQACRKLHAVGIVGMHCMDGAASLFHLRRLAERGALEIRCVHAIQLADLASAVSLGLRSGLGDDWFRLGGVKIFADGSLGSQTAYMFEEYPGRPGYRGVPVLVGEALTEAVTKAAEAGWACWIHAIGDQAVHDAIGAIAKACRVRTPPALPHRIEHAQCVRPNDIRRMARLGIVASVQPCHILHDIAAADRWWPQARRHAYPLGRMLRAGVTLAAGSDVPVEPPDPRQSLHAAVCRTDEHNRPAGGWFADQTITARQVLRAFTVGAARAAGLPPPAGTLTTGAAADLTIWYEDPLAVPATRLREIPIAGCVIGGKPFLNDEVI